MTGKLNNTWKYSYKKTKNHQIFKNAHAMSTQAVSRGHLE